MAVYVHNNCIASIAFYVPNNRIYLCIQFSLFTMPKSDLVIESKLHRSYFNLYFSFSSFYFVRQVK